MLFTDLTFLYFHAIVVALRWWLPPRAAGPLLLVASYVFYLSAGPRYVALIFGATVFAWWVGLALSRATRPKALLGFAVAALLAMLAWFKYSAFAAQQVAALLHLPRPAFTVALPLAISFFSFELISYVVDVRRGTTPERSLWRFALYVSYYPHLIAGPIVRAEELLPSLRAPKPFDDTRFGDGVYILLIGFLKKTVLADRMAPWADAVFSDPSAHGTLGVWMGVLAYTGQIYCDFSGYTDIARGASLTLGLPLPENFDWPYLSTSITEFWRRWHMTLSRWLRDYLYIGLGGNRGGPLRQYRNLLLTMLLGGLWHGANWTFVAWGALHGLALCAHKLWDTALRGFPLAQRCARRARTSCSPGPRRCSRSPPRGCSSERRPSPAPGRCSCGSPTTSPASAPSGPRRPPPCAPRSTRSSPSWWAISSRFAASAGRCTARCRQSPAGSTGR
ncbi:MAG: MBOAT family protein [Deltaproteobacteria bacterium]|nr:MBOAT family protein [Deltaproteobacteria bacterium]